ncbi:DnaJ C-terminal domain-containing protein [Ornithinimicrobium pekingense]|uniref:Molecular chaperone DnaJ n=1 Tax=Ornithinimicrobium pekingense TaxID=384677 RepID=A0ABQ2F408_9MICO|nr:DnaJ C-terminal domain-containing protein [Ornithinimicrobium pekingense]GGK57083.1 molecular chaperone DnaJ [Ornithinimicrobium pekingense]
MVSQDWMEKDFYAILGVPKDVDEKTLKKTYRKLAREWHPDSKPGDAAAEQKFKDIGEAYAVLSDPEQRKQYDAVRAMGGGARFTAGGPGGPGGGGFEDVFAQMFGGGGGAQNVRFSTGGGGGIDLEDLLGAFGGAGGFQPGGGQGFPGGGQGFPGGFGQRGQRGTAKGQDVEARTAIDFRAAASGDTVTLSKPDGGRITTRIPAGVKDGQKIRLRGKGMPSPVQGGEPGDLILHVTVRPHPVFGRDGDNLTVDLPVTFSEAALGATVAVPTLDGGTVKVRIAPGTPSGRVLRVKGRGIETSKGTGDLLVRVQVVVPQRLSDAAREAVETLRDEEGAADPRSELMRQARA